MAQWDLQCLCSGRDMGSVPGLVQWVEDPALLELLGTGHNSESLAQELHMAQSGQKRKEKKKEKEKKAEITKNDILCF